MIYDIYAIKDELAGTFGNLMVMLDKVAERNFKWIMLESEKADCDDRRIYYMGKYDNESGAIYAEQPKLVYNLEEEKKNAKENL